MSLKLDKQKCKKIRTGYEDKIINISDVSPISLSRQSHCII